MSTILQDLRFALRQLRRAPSFALGVVLVLALGTGANAALFSVVSATLLRHLPYASPSQLVSINEVNSKGVANEDNILDLEQWRERSRTLTELAYYNRPGNWSGTYLSIAGTDQPIDNPWVSSNLFSVLGVQPALGRPFTPDEQHPGQSHVVMLSNILWQTHFHGDPGVLGRIVSIADVPYTVVGVMPRGFVFPANPGAPQVWTPAELPADRMNRGYSALQFDVIARRRSSSTLAAVQAEIKGIQQSLSPLYTGDVGTLLVPKYLAVQEYRASLNRKERPALLALLSAVFLLWLIACANAASLMLARGASRRSEIAIRGALGASRWRLVRQLFVESLLLALAAGAAGLVLSQTLLHLFSRILLRQLGAPVEVSPSFPVLGALLGLTLLSAALFGILPTLLSTDVEIERSLRRGGAQSGVARSQHRLQSSLIVSELALTLVLISACGLLLRTVLALHQVPLGFRTDHMVVVEPKLPVFRYRGQDLAQRLYLPMLERVRAIPGVTLAGMATVVPLSETFDANMNLYLTKSGSSSPKTIVAKMRASSPEMQQILGFHMLKGRYFNAGDTATSQPVAVVNRAFADLYNPVNQDIVDYFSLKLDKNRRINIVGIMDDFHQVGVAAAPAPEIDFCLPQLRPTDNFYQPTIQGHIELALRTARDPTTVLPDVLRALHDVAPELNASSIRTMDQVVDDAIGPQRLAAHLLETLGALALIIALAGLYGLLAYLVTLRTREFGLRLALGAQRSNVLALVLRNAGVLLLTGTVLGVGISLATAHLLTRFLFGVKEHDLPTLCLSSALLLLVGIVASWLPAHRAASLEPMQALRTE